MGSRLGRFEIQAEIGHGGFGKVFRALDPIMNRVVAVKVLTATEDVDSFTRFKNEATPRAISTTPTSSPFTSSARRAKVLI